MARVFFVDEDSARVADKIVVHQNGNITCLHKTGEHGDTHAVDYPSHRIHRIKRDGRTDVVYMDEPPLAEKGEL